MDWKVGDWVAFDLSIVQIKELREGGCVTISDSFFETSGQLLERLRPLTLKNKRVVETFDIYYNRLKQIDGEAGFNYPDISSYFCHLALLAMDHEDEKEFHDKANQFIASARDYASIIHGVRLFRRAA